MIKVALTNLGKYNEGTLDFVWVDLPTTEEKIAEAFEAIEVADGTQYEESFFSDWEAPECMGVSQYSDIYRLNEIAERLAEVDGIEKLFDGSYTVEDYLNIVHELEAHGMILEASPYIDDIVTDEELDEMVKHRAKDGGWQGVAFFLHGVQSMTDDYYYINGYANAEDLTWDTLEAIVSDMISELRKGWA